MGPRIWGRASVSYAFGLSLAFLGLAASLLVFVIAASWHYTSFTAIDWVVCCIYLACITYTGSGLLLWWFRPSNRLGPLMVVAGFVWILLGLDTLPPRAIAAAGQFFGVAPLAALFHVLLAFPSGRLRSPFARIVVTLGWFSALGLSLPQNLYDPRQTFHIGDRPGVVHFWHSVQLWGATVPLTIAAAWILLSRIQRTEPRLRFVLWPLYGYGVLLYAGTPILADFIGPQTISPSTLFGIQAFTLALAPVFFALAAVSGAFGRTGQVDELAAWLARTRGSERDMEQVLAGTLGDPSLRLLFWLSDAGHYVDADGSVVKLPAANSGERGVVPIDIGDRHVGAIVYDNLLIADPAPVRATAQVVAISVDRERLLADLRASEEELRRSRTRIVETGDLERRRFAQSLHDSVQGQLVLLAIQARALADDPSTPERLRAEALALWSGIDATASDLRQQVHTVMPALLLERGLVAAIEERVDRVNVPTTLTVGDLDHALPAPVQTTAYFIVAEALTNAVKHAHADRISVVLDETEAGLVVTVEDDGVGGAGPTGGSGLRGLTDRAEALGGRLTVDSAPGRGTRLTAVLPSQPIGNARV